MYYHFWWLSDLSGCSSRLFSRAAEDRLTKRKRILQKIGNDEIYLKEKKKVYINYRLTMNSSGFSIASLKVIVSIEASVTVAREN
jgi:hypothetical protein